MKRLALALALLWGGAAQAAETVALRAAPHPGYARIVFDWQTPAAYQASLNGRILTVRFARPFEAKIAVVTDRLPDDVASVRMEADGRTVTVALKGSYVLHPRSDGGIVILDLLQDKLAARARAVGAVAPAAGPAPVAAKPAKPDSIDAVVDRALRPTPIHAEAPENGDGQRAHAEKLKGDDAPPRAGAVARAVRPASVQGAPFVSVDVLKGRDVSSVRFNWRTAVGAAAFQRRGQLWVVFDDPSRIELSSLQVNGAPLITAVEQVPVAGGSAIRLALDSSRHARVRRDGTVWVVDILPGTPIARTGIGVLAQPGNDGRLVLPIEGGSRVLRLRDPEVGDTIDAVTLTASGLGVTQPRRFVEVEVLESAQGVAVRPIADQVAVETTAEQIVIDKPGGLSVSPDADRPRSADRPDGGRGRLFDFAGWAKGPGATFAQSREELFRRAAATTNDEVKRNARLALARFYLGNAFGPEALGVIDQIVRSEPGGIADMALRAMRGVARVLSGEYALANDDLRHPVLLANPEVAPWRATVAAARGDWKSAQQEFRDLESVWDDYPTWLAARMGLTAIEASLAIGDTGTASARIETLDKRDLEPADRQSLDVLRGYLSKLSGNVDGAIALWRTVARSKDRKAEARARYALATTLYERKEASLDETIDQMEQLRYAWRGDEHEFDLLRRLAQLYSERGDSRDALQTLKEAATYFHNIEGVQSVARDMSQTFRRLFADGGADKLDAVTALALFDEFRELAPSGPEGDAMVRKFAERLASVDLLDDAARLLEQQVKSRLKGEEKARVGLQLATWRLADRKPQAALDALAESAEADVPSELAHDRLLVQARALAAAGKGKEALGALGDDSSAAAERIRAMVQWRAKSWKPAAEAFARLMQDPNLPPPDLPALVISRAVALTLAGDDPDVTALYAKYAEMMKTSPYADAFLAVAGPDNGRPRDFRAAARIADEITSLEALLGDKNKKVTAGS